MAADPQRSAENAEAEQRMFEFGMRRYQERLDHIVADLRRMADEVEREGRVRDEALVMGTPALIWSAQTAVHRVMWGLANLNLDLLVQIAGDTELARSVMVATDAEPAGSES